MRICNTLSHLVFLLILLTGFSAETLASTFTGLATGQLSDTTVDNIVGYHGYVFNNESQQYTVRFRTYDPGLGRFVQRDPAGYVDGMSLYEFVGSGPTLYTDPMGLDAWSDLQNDLYLAQDLYGSGRITNAQFKEVISSYERGVRLENLRRWADFAIQPVKEGIDRINPLNQPARIQRAFENLRANLQQAESVYMNSRNTGAGFWEAAYLTDAFLISNYVGARDLYEGIEGSDVVTLEEFSTEARICKTYSGSLTIVGTAVAGAKLFTATASSLRPAKPAASGPMGRSGAPLENAPYQPVRNAPGVVNGRQYTGHAFDQMQNRGITPSVVENTITNNRGIPGKYSGSTLYYDPINNVSVVTNTANGRVVTVTFGQLKGSG